jgi:hypothetical protein
MPVEIYREAKDGGQDAVFLSRPKKSDGSVSRATIQCKFSSDPGKRFAASQLTVEKQHIRDLVAAGEAETYVFMTSMSVSAPIASDVKKTLRSLGVLRPHVLGREFLTRAIRASARLRALVPQVYGLGDLSLILDIRKAEQTKALLAQWLPALRSYVPTESHRKAIKALGDHRVVLLLGNPASGKSTIAAILTTFALESEKNECFKVDGPKEFGQHWDPCDRR